MKQFLKKWLGPIIIVVTLATVLIVSAVNGTLPEAIEAVRGANPLCMLLCVVCYLCFMLMNAVGVRSFLHKEGYDLTIGQSVSATLTGIYYSNITPGAAGGQPMQVHYLTKYGIPVGIGTSAIAVTYISWYLMRVVLVTVLGIVYWDSVMYNLGQYWPFLLAGYTYNVVMLIVLLLFSFSRRPVQLLVRFVSWIMQKLHLSKDPSKTAASLERTAERFHNSMQHLRSHNGEIVRQLLLGGLYMMFLVSILFFSFRGVGLTGGSYGEIVTLGLCQYISAAYMPTPGASGAQEGLFELYFGKMMPAGASLLAVMLIWRFMSFYLGMILGAIANLVGRRLNTKATES